MRAESTVVSCIILSVLAAAMVDAAPAIDVLLSLKVDGMTEGDRLQNAAYCLEAGRQAREQGKLGTAMDLFNKTLELNAEASEVHWEKAILLTDDRVGLYSQAMAELRLFLATNPNYGHALAELGSAYQRRGRIAEAEEQYKLAVAKDPRDPYALGKYGAFLIMFGDRVQEGIDDEKSAIAGGDTGPWIQMMLAWGYVRLEKYSDARARAKSAIASLRPVGDQQGIDEMNRLLVSIEGR